MNLPEAFEDQFKELNAVVKELREQNATRALVWAHANQKALEEIGSDLLFSLHQARLSMLIRRSVDL